MKNVLLITLFTGLALSANVSMASTNNIEAQNLTPKASVEVQQENIKDAVPSLKENAETKTDMIQSKLEGQAIQVAAAEKVENCWAWDACLNSQQSNIDGYDSYAFN
ncbi:MAG: hypothetical protein U9R28_08055 [Pseudomonadota bacterium]|nr:hypothetical protein [Pseudomonadota bacterium]